MLLVEPVRFARRGFGRHTSEPALAAAEFLHGSTEVFVAKIRPHPARKNQLGVSTLPEKKIAQPPLAARANQQVDRRPEDPVYGLTRQMIGAMYSGQNRIAPGVIDGNPQAEPISRRKANILNSYSRLVQANETAEWKAIIDVTTADRTSTSWPYGANPVAVTLR